MKKLSKIKLKSEVAMTDNEMKFIMGGYESTDKNDSDCKKVGDDCYIYHNGIRFKGACEYAGWLYTYVCASKQS